MDIISIIGIVSAVFFVVYGILLSGSVLAFIDIPSIVIVFGGTAATILLSSKKKNVKQIHTLIKLVFKEKPSEDMTIIDNFVQWAIKARRSGLLSLEDEIEQIQDSFIKKGLMMIVDGVEPDTIRMVLDLKISGLIERHKNNRALFDTGATLAPAFGMLGTLIGLINMLKTLDDPSAIGPQMSVALVTTFYGSILANLFFIPMSKKLKAKTDEEVYQKEMIIEGLLSIQAGENPNVLKEKMLAYLNDKENKKFEEESKNLQENK